MRAVAITYPIQLVGYRDGLFLALTNFVQFGRILRLSPLQRVERGEFSVDAGLVN